MRLLQPFAALLWWASEWSGIGLGGLAPHVLGIKLGSRPMAPEAVTEAAGDPACLDCPHFRADHCPCTPNVRHCTQCSCIDFNPGNPPR